MTARRSAAARRAASYVSSLEAKIEQLDRRLNNILREARVTEVDAEKRALKVQAHGLPSFWVPWDDAGGANVDWTPPSVGERVLFVSPTGEPGQGLIVARGYAGKHEVPPRGANERSIERGEKVLEQQDDPPRQRLHYGSKAVIVERETRIQIKVRPEEEGEAPLHITLDLERMVISTSIPFILEPDPYPDD